MLFCTLNLNNTKGILFIFINNSNNGCVIDLSIISTQKLVQILKIFLILSLTDKKPGISGLVYQDKIGEQISCLM